MLAAEEALLQQVQRESEWEDTQRKVEEALLAESRQYLDSFDDAALQAAIAASLEATSTAS